MVLCAVKEARFSCGKCPDPWKTVQSLGRWLWRSQRQWLWNDFRTYDETEHPRAPGKVGEGKIHVAMLLPQQRISPVFSFVGTTLTMSSYHSWINFIGTNRLIQTIAVTAHALIRWEDPKPTTGYYGVTTIYRKWLWSSCMSMFFGP